MSVGFSSSSFRRVCVAMAWLVQSVTPRLGQLHRLSRFFEANTSLCSFSLACLSLLRTRPAFAFSVLRSASPPNRRCVHCGGPLSLASHTPILPVMPHAQDQF